MTQRIIIFDLDQRSNEHLRGILMSHFGVYVTPTLQELEKSLRDKDFHIVICEFGALYQSREDIPKLIRSIQPDVKLVLITPFDSEHYISSLRDWGCYHVLPKLPFYNALDIILFMENVIDPVKAFGLIRYLSGDAECKRVQVTTRAGKNQIVEDIVNYFASCEYEIHELYDVRLIMEEAINNALFHAFLTEDGKEKYNPETFNELEEGDEVWLEYGANATTIGFSVEDNCGSLRPDIVIKKLSRQYNREGLLDENGRGLYLSRMLSGQMVFNIHQHVRTQIVTLFYEKRLNVPKPFSINYIPG